MVIERPIILRREALIPTEDATHRTGAASFFALAIKQLFVELEGG